MLTKNFYANNKFYCKLNYKFIITKEIKHIFLFLSYFGLKK